MKKQVRVIHDSSTVSTENSFEIKSEPTYVTDMKDEPVYYGNNSARGLFNYYKRSNSNSKLWKYNRQRTQHKSMSTHKYGWKTNPVYRNGNITKCSISQSIYHWYKECPYKIDDADGNQVKLSLFSKEVYNCFINKFAGETFNHAVLDSECTKTVCGESWLTILIL